MSKGVPPVLSHPLSLKHVALGIEEWELFEVDYIVSVLCVALGATHRTDTI